MVSLTMMARLLEAVRPDALGWCWSATRTSCPRSRPARCWPTSPARRVRRTRGWRRRWPSSGRPPANDAPPVHGVVQLTRTWRYGGAIDALARAIRAADPDAALERAARRRGRRRLRRGRPRGRSGAAGRRGHGGPGRAGTRAPGGVPSPRPRPATSPPPSPRWTSTGCSAPTAAGPYGVARWSAGGRALAGRGDPGLRRGRRVVPRPTAAGHRQRLRHGALQRRHRRHRRYDRRRPGRVRPRRGGQRSTPRSGWTRSRPCTR